MKKCAVVIRHLPGSRPVTACIIEEPNDTDIDDLEHYFHSKAQNAIRDCKKLIPEMEKADWYVDIVSLT